MSDNRTLSKNVKAGGAAAALLAFITLGAWQVPHVGASADAGKAPAAVSAPSVPGVPAVTTYAPTVEQVTPAVVTIRTQGKARMVPTGGQLPPELRNFFGREFQTPRQPRNQRGLGSGVIVSHDGYILTNNHVVDSADDIKVELPNKRTYTAKLVGTDPATDLAVLKIDATALPVLTMGDSGNVRVGDVVLAVGNPLGIGQTVTMGIVSAKGRTTGVGDGGYEDFLQTDAPINQGNSGGALVSLDGKLIGINSQILSPSGGNIGVGFAIPSNMARNVMDQLIQGGRVHRSRLGVSAQGITADLAASLGLKEVKGALVSKVEEGSAASRAGLRQGDVILAVNGRTVSDSNELRNEIASIKPGTTVALSVVRDGRQETVQAKLEELPAERAKAGSGPEASGSGRFGMNVQPLTPELAERLDVARGTKGVAVVDVDPDGQAAASGLEAGDVIEKVNGQAIASVDQLRAALESTSTRPALVLVNRKGTTLFFTLRAPRS